MIGRNGFAFSSHPYQRHGFRAIAPRGHHHAKYIFVNQIRARAAEPRGEQPVRRRRRATALHVTQDGDARFEVREFLKLFCESERVAGVPGIERGKFEFGLVPFVRIARLLPAVFGGGKGARVFQAHRALRHGRELWRDLPGEPAGLGGEGGSAVESASSPEGVYVDEARVYARVEDLGPEAERRYYEHRLSDCALCAECDAALARRLGEVA